MPTLNYTWKQGQCMEMSCAFFCACNKEVSAFLTAIHSCVTSCLEEQGRSWNLFANSKWKCGKKNPLLGSQMHLKLPETGRWKHQSPEMSLFLPYHQHHPSCIWMEPPPSLFLFRLLSSVCTGNSPPESDERETCGRVPWAFQFALQGMVLHHHCLWPRTQILTRREVLGSWHLPTTQHLSWDPSDRSIGSHCGHLPDPTGWQSVPPALSSQKLLKELIKNLHGHLDLVSHKGE